MAFVNYFLIAGVDANNSPTVRLTSRSKICFVIVVALTDSFKTLLTRRCLFFSTFFLFIAVFTSGIAVLEAVEGVIMEGVGAELSSTGFHSPNQTFFGMAYSFSF